MATLSIVQRISGNTKPLRDTQRAIDDVGRSGGSTNTILSRLQSNMSSAVAGAARLAGAGLLAFGAAVGGAAAAGLRFNNSMEQVEARLFAFLKDGDAVNDMLDMIRDRASRTPFAFEEMANATAALVPVAKQSGEEIERLIGLAEILAASNPAEGLEGAAFSLKEAAGGDFTSIIERFNLSRQTINRLKDEGVPALEAVQIAMQELGLDADLVTGLSQTLSGRWSTLKDKFTTMASTLTQPIFDRVSNGVGNLLTVLDDRGPEIDAFIERVGNKINGIATGFEGFFTALKFGRDPLESLGYLLVHLAGNIFPMTEEGYEKLGENIFAFIDAARAIIMPIVDFIRENVKLKDALIALGIIVAAVLLPALWAIAAPILGVIAVFALLTAAVALIRHAWENNFAGIQEFTSGIWLAMQQAFGAFQALFAGDWQGFLDGMKAAWDTAWTALTEFVGNLWSIIQPKLEEWWMAFTTWFSSQDWAAHWETFKTTVTDTFSTLWGIVQPKLEEWWTSITDWYISQDWAANWEAFKTSTSQAFTDLWAIIQPQLESWWTAVSEWFNSVDWAGMWESFKTTVSETFSNLWGQVQPILSEWYTSFVDWVNTADWALIAQTITESIITGLGLFVGTVAGTLAAWYQKVDQWARDVDWATVAKTIVGSIGAALMLLFSPEFQRVAGEWLLDMAEEVTGIEWGRIGSDIVSGIAAGLSNATSILSAAAKSAAQAAFDAAKRLLGISSPSKLFEKEIGMNIGFGMIQGLEKIRPAVQKATEALALPPPRPQAAVVAAALTPQVAFAPAPGRGIGDLTFNININGAVGDARQTAQDVAAAVRDELAKIGISANGRRRLNG